MHGSLARRLPLAVAALLFGSGAAHGETPVFQDVTLQAGITHTHGYTQDNLPSRHMFLAGAAAADYDGDGWIDLYVIRGSIGPNLLYRNLGDGTFEDVAAVAGVAGGGSDIASGALFFDADGDGRLDLFVGGVLGTPNRLFIANGDGMFKDRTGESGLPALLETYSASAADYDRDGDLDLFLAHWGAPLDACHLWQNNGHGKFTCADRTAGIQRIGDALSDLSFTGNFSDLDGDRWPDLVVTGDFGTSRVFVNRRDGTFHDATDATITDENGMGAAVGDYDNDGDIDWFVSSIYDATEVPNGGAWGFSGNRMYRNRGDGSLEDATDGCGVREGGWGWGASFADFDNDGWLDLVHVNGWPRETDLFLDDAARLFMNDQQGAFVQSAEAAGCASPSQGRGVVCFDYDRDGDLDLFIANFGGAPELLRNDGAAGNHWLALSLRGRGKNTRAIGARVRIEAGGVTQTREMMCGNNYLSQNPAEIHVGLGASERAERLVIDWPNGSSTTVTNVATDQRLVLDEPAAPPAPKEALRVVRAYPNPFRDETTLRIDGASATVTVAIYDVAGRRVRQLATTSGVVRWDGRADNGMPVPAGVYWVRVSDGAATVTSRVVLVR